MMKDAENVRVVVRVRPLTEREECSGDSELVSCQGDRSVQVIEQHGRGRPVTGTAFQFNQCFGVECGQEQLFERCGVLSLLDHVLDGYSATVFAYGPTGSGKTYTITGRPDSILKYGSGDASDGIVIRSVEALFDKIRGQQRDGLQFKVRTSCVEIYNENVLDLFRYNRNAHGNEYLPVKFDTNRGSFFVGDLSYGKCNSEEDLLRLYMKALRNRSVASHQLNQDSSRSHCILTVYVDSMVAAENGHISTRHGKISFVDLAGSERLKDSQSVGSTLRETGAINKSIFTLGKVISSLCDRKKTKVPYRDSKLTQLLMDSIGGTSMTIMLACVSPATSHLNETMRTLKYASSAKNIKNKPVVLLDPHQTMVSELKKEIDQLRAENKALRDALLGQSVQGPFHVHHDGSRSSSAPDNHVADRPNYPSENLRHSTGGLPAGVRQLEHSHNRSSDSVFSSSSPQVSSNRGRMSDNGPVVVNGRARNYNRMPSVHQRPSPLKSKGNGANPTGYGKVSHSDPSLQRRRDELSPTPFQMPHIHANSGTRSVQENQAEETALYHDLQSIAHFSYFNQDPSADTSPKSLLNHARHSGGRVLPFQEQERLLANQRVKTAEQRLRDEILQLPEAQKHLPPHQRRVLQPGERRHSKLAVDSKIRRGAGNKKSKSPRSERMSMRELEKLSKYSYFKETENQGHNAFAQWNYNSLGKHSVAHRADEIRHAHIPSDTHMTGQRSRDAPHDDSTFLLHSKRGGGPVSTFMTDHYNTDQSSERQRSLADERAALRLRDARNGRATFGEGYTTSGYASQHGSSFQSDTEHQRYQTGNLSPKSIRDRPAAGSPRSIRSSAANPDGIHKTNGAHNGHARPSSADRDRLLDDALDDFIGAAPKNENWMNRLNQPAGMTIDRAVAGNLRSEIDRLPFKAPASGLGPSTSGGASGALQGNGALRVQSPAMLNGDRPRSANRPPSVPRNYLQSHDDDLRRVPPAPALAPKKESLVSGGEGGSGGSSYEELMRNLEQSRLKAQQARLSILEKKKQWNDEYNA